jgi:nucleoside-diphosphate-sugar epimerase
MRVLIVGCGYIGIPLGAELVRREYEVYGLRRTASADKQLRSFGISPLVGDITQPNALAALPASFDWVINCAASSGGGPNEYRAVYLRGTQNLLNWLSDTPPTKYIYTSSTSVYGQTDGSLVNEQSATEPAVETGKILVQTEQLLMQAFLEKNFPAVIVRLAGIYGPGRGYWLERFLDPLATIEGTGNGWMNMIHQADAVGTIIAALTNGRPGEIYNGVDDEPVRRLDFFRWLAGALGRGVPPISNEAADQHRKRGLSDKRVSNHKLQTELNYRFKFPTFRDGYATEIRRNATHD